jgi:DNA polymerase-1
MLFEELGLPAAGVKKTSSGQYTTDEKTLSRLVCAHPVVQDILEYRACAKLKSTYVDKLPQLIDAEGRVHTTFSQSFTETGRLSSSNPNLQNIPVRTDEGRKIRDAFVPKEGCTLMSADYSQIELVVLSHVSGDANLRSAFLEGNDVHRETAAKMFDIFPEMVTPEQRRMAKTINFGIMYGMSPFRLAGELKISLKSAKEFIERYFERYSGVSAFVGKIKAQAYEDGFVRTAMGHIRYIPEIKSSNKTVRSTAERVAVNTVIQGTAAEIMKLAMISLSKAMEEKGMKSRMLLQVHDEVIFEVPESEVDEMKTLVRSCMEQAYRLSIPLRVGIETGHSWGEMH